MNKYEYEYFLQNTYSTNTNINIILDILCHENEQEYYLYNIFSNIFKYLNEFEYLKLIKPQVTATYQSEDCGYDIKIFFFNVPYCKLG